MPALIWTAIKTYSHPSSSFRCREERLTNSLSPPLALGFLLVQQCPSPAQAVGKFAKLKHKLFAVSLSHASMLNNIRAVDISKIHHADESTALDGKLL